MGHRYVELYSATKADMNKARDWRSKASHGHGDDMDDAAGERGGDRQREGDDSSEAKPEVVKIRGLPYSASENEVEAFFGGIQLVQPNGVQLGRSHDGRMTGEGFVKVANEEALRAAMTLHRSKLGSRYLELFRSSMAEFNVASMRGGNPGSRGGNGRGGNALQGAGGDSVRCTALRMRGLPYSVTFNDIGNFFQGFHIIPNGINLLHNREGRLSGEAIVQFSGDDECHRAVSSRNKERIGTRYIELFKEAGGASSGGGGGGPGGANHHPGNPGNMHHGGHHRMHNGGRGAGGEMHQCGPYQGLGGGAGMPSGGGGGGGPGPHPGAMHPPHHGHQGGGGPGAGGQFGGHDPHFMHHHQPAQHYGHGYGHQHQFSQSGQPQQGGSHHGGGQPQYGPQGPGHNHGGGAGHGGHGFPPGHEHGMAGDGQGGQPFVVRMRGLPFRATSGEIVEFFQQYGIIRDSVHIGTDSDGRPSGEAHVSFVSHQEAERAVRERNKGHIGTRYVELFLQ